MISRIIVTGTSGFIGRRLVRYLRNAGREVFEHKRSVCDLRDREKVKVLIERFRPDRIVHLAAQRADTEDKGWQEIASEVEMLSNLARAMPTHCRLIHAGSVAEYGTSGKLQETQFCSPKSAYGFAKLAATNFALSVRGQNSLDVCIARLFGVYGPGEGPSRLVPHLVAKLSSNELVLLSDGNQVRDFIHVDDVCRILGEYCDRGSVEMPVLNIGTGQGLSVKTVCLRVAQFGAFSPNLLQFGKLSRRSVDEDELVADISNLSQFTEVPVQHWTAPIGLAQAYVENLIESHKIECS
jgi:nucleoside-diphosphate-sugar epimerase